MTEIPMKFSKEYKSRFWKKVKIGEKDECWNWLCGTQSKGYGSVCIGNGTTALAHRVAFEISSGYRIPEGLCVMHKCDNRLCCNPYHLKLGTIADNNRDSIRKGRNARGERNGRSKLTEKQVIEIRDLYKTGKYSQSKIALMYSVSPRSISGITREDYWKLPLVQ